MGKPRISRECIEKDDQFVPLSYINVATLKDEWVAAELATRVGAEEKALFLGFKEDYNKFKPVIILDEGGAYCLVFKRRKVREWSTVRPA